MRLVVVVGVLVRRVSLGRLVRGVVVSGTSGDEGAMDDMSGAADVLLTGGSVGLTGVSVVSRGLLVGLPVVVVRIGAMVVVTVIVVGSVVGVATINDDGTADGAMYTGAPILGGLEVGSMGDGVPQLEPQPKTSVMQSPSSFPVRSHVGQQVNREQTESILLQDCRTRLSALVTASVQVVAQLPVVS